TNDRLRNRHGQGIIFSAADKAPPNACREKLGRKRRPAGKAGMRQKQPAARESLLSACVCAAPACKLRAATARRRHDYFLFSKSLPSLRAWSTAWPGQKSSSSKN